MNKFFIRGIVIGSLTTILLGGLFQLRFRTPKIIDYHIIYAGAGDTLTSICQEEYSSKIRDKIGLETLIYNCIEKTPDGVLKEGEGVLVPVYKEGK